MTSAATAIPIPGEIERHPRSAQLLFELSRLARAEGANVGRWPGLTIYRFTRPTKPRWDEIERLSVAIIAQAGRASTAVGDRRLYGRIGYAVIGGRRHFDCHILEASAQEPAMCFVLEIDAQVVRSVSARMGGLVAAGQVDEKCPLSAVDHELIDTVLRFLGALSVGVDRRVLAPLHLQEMVFRMLQGDQRTRLVQLAACQSVGSPVAAALDFIEAHLAEPLTVDILAAQACLSPSAFSRVFRQMTDRSPYQYLKETRLDHARRLLVEGRVGVADVSCSVGYSSVSHFIKEFRSRFGVTPGDYSAAHAFRGRVRALSVADGQPRLRVTVAS
jgi:AraC-like DNA-binding protein